MISFSCSFHFIHCFCWIKIKKNKRNKNKSIKQCWWWFTIPFLSLFFFSSSFNKIPLQIFIVFHSFPTEYLSGYLTYLYMCHFDISLPSNIVSIDWIPSSSFLFLNLFFIIFLFFSQKNFKKKTKNKLWENLPTKIFEKHFSKKNVLYITLFKIKFINE